MLVLSRKKNQAIRIGDLGIIRVVAITDNRVRLAFDFPASVPIDREEVAVKKQERKQLEGL